MARFRRRLACFGVRCALIALLIGSFASARLAAPVAGQLAPGLYVEATGHVLADPFLNYWTARDGMSVLGWPVTEAAQREQTRVQYFDYGALTTNSPTASVTRIATGRELLRLAHNPARLLDGRRVANARETIAFRRQPRTSPTSARRAAPSRGAAIIDLAFTVSPRFDDFYARNGGIARFGFPLSLPYHRRGLTVQWFEYARLETRPDAGTDIWVGPIGLELARAHGMKTAKVTRGSLPLLERRNLPPSLDEPRLWNARVGFVPTRIAIPAIGVDAEIEPAGIVDGKMEAPQNAWKVAWYPSLSAPGTNENAVMAAHKDFWGIGPTVFANLHLVQAGDTIEVLGASGVRALYRVTRTWEVGAGSNPMPVVGNTEGETLTLFTCSGSFDGFDYDKRLIVRAERI